MDDIGFNRQIGIDEIGSIRVIRPDASNQSRCQEDVCGPFLFKESFHLPLAGKVELRPASRHQVSVSGLS
jgi:hypothetical protein